MEWKKIRSWWLYALLGLTALGVVSDGFASSSTVAMPQEKSARLLLLSRQLF
jgi:hypothetical protein